MRVFDQLVGSRWDREFCCVSDGCLHRFCGEDQRIIDVLPHCAQRPTVQTRKERARLPSDFMNRPLAGD